MYPGGTQRLMPHERNTGRGGGVFVGGGLEQLTVPFSASACVCLRPIYFGTSLQVPVVFAWRVNRDKQSRRDFSMSCGVLAHQGANERSGGHVGHLEIDPSETADQGEVA